MKLTTIWTMPAMPLRERAERTAELATRVLARHLPRRLAYWSLIDSGARHIRPDEVVPEVRFTDVLQRAWGPAHSRAQGETTPSGLDSHRSPSPISAPQASAHWRLLVAGHDGQCS